MPQVRRKENQLATYSMYIFLLRMGSKGFENREQRKKHFEDKHSSFQEATSGLDTHGAHFSLAHMES